MTTSAGQQAFDNIKSDLTTLPQFVNGYCLSLHLTKDITRNSILGRDAYSGEQACHAGSLYQSHIAALLGYDGASDKVLADFSSRVNFWVLILKHKLVWICLIYLLKVFLHVQPLVVDCDSSKVANIFRIGAPEAMFTSNQAWSCAFAFAPDNYEALEGLVRVKWTSPVWDKLRWPVWILSIGEFFILRWGPLPHQCSIVIVNLHTVWIKYDPACERLAMRLFDIVA